MKNEIPKIIHYCWFGGNKKSKLIKKCIDSWKKYCPDYEIVEWNEKNFDINKNMYIKQAYECKKWAFVSDYVRLDVVYNHGGIYLDTDVELIKSLDDLLGYDAFLACENDYLIATGLGFGAIKNNSIIKKILDSYINIPFINVDGTMDLTACTTRNTDTLIEIFGDISKKINIVLDGNVIFLGKEYLCPFDVHTGVMKKTNDTHGIHWYNASWRDRKLNIRERFLRPIKRLIGYNNFEKFKRMIKK